MRGSFGRPDPIDAYVSARVVALRTGAGLSRSRLAERMGISVQQLHKYEMGGNRIPASRLPLLAEIFATPIESFFPARPEDARLSPDTRALHVLAASPEGRAITAQFGRIRDRDARRALAILAEALARPA